MHDDAPDPRDVGDRIERLLDDLHSRLDPRAYGAVEDLVRLLTDLYGGGLARVVDLAGEASPELLDRLADDELVASLLIVHGLHPSDLTGRIEAALESVRPFLAHHDGDVELLDVDADAGAVRLRLLGSCDGCPSSSVTLKLAVERAIVEAAPEIVRIDVDDAGAEPVVAGPVTPVSLIRKPVYDACPTELVSPMTRLARRAAACARRRVGPEAATRRDLRAVQRADRRHPRARRRPRESQPHVRLPRLLPAVHRGGSRRIAVPCRPGDVPVAPRRAPVSGALGRHAGPGRRRLLLPQLRRRPGRRVLPEPGRSDRVAAAARRLG